MIVVVPMAGSDDLFKKHDFPFAKAVTEIDGLPLIEHTYRALKSLPDDPQFVFVIRKEDDLRFYLRDVLMLLNPRAEVVRAGGPTAGAACTALLAVESIADEEELVITNGDQLIDVELSDVISDFRARNLDAGTIVFDSVHPRWSFVKTDEQGLVVEAAEKRPISRNATAGFYYFRRGRDFVEAAQKMIRKGASTNGAYFVCPCFNEMILAQKRVGIFQIDRDRYISLANPQAIEEYEQMLVARRHR